MGDLNDSAKWKGSWDIKHDEHGVRLGSKFVHIILIPSTQQDRSHVQVLDPKMPWEKFNGNGVSLT